MSRNWGITSPAASGGQGQPPGSHDADTRVGLNSLSGDPLRRSDLAVVVYGSPSLLEHELHPIEPFDAGFDHREFAVYVWLSACGISIGVLLAAATALLDWS